MFKTVLWATDGSEAAERALPVAQSIAQTYGARLLVVHVNEIPTMYPFTANAAEVTEEAIREALQRRVEDLERDGLTVGFASTDVTMRGTAHAIAELARDQGADLIVAGTRGKSQLVRALVGSVTRRLLELSPCPVLAVPPTDDDIEP